MKLYVAVLVLLIGGSAFAQTSKVDFNRETMKSSEVKAITARPTLADLMKAADFYARNQPAEFQAAYQDAMARLGNDERRARLSALVRLVNHGDQREFKAVLADARAGRETPLTLLAEHVAKPDPNQTLLGSKEALLPLAKRLLRLTYLSDEGSRASSGKIAVRHNDQSIEIDQAKLRETVQEEIQYFVRVYQADKIQKKCSCSISWGISDQIREKYDYLVRVRDLLDGKSSEDPLDASKLFETFSFLDTASSGYATDLHTDHDLDAHQLEEYRARLQLQAANEARKISQHQAGVIRPVRDNIPSPYVPVGPKVQKGNQ